VAIEWEGIGSVIAASGWNLGASVAPEQVVVPGLAITPVVGASASGEDVGFGGTFSGFLPADPGNPANAAPPPVAGAGSVPPSTPAVAPPVASATDTDAGGTLPEGILRNTGKFASGGLGHGALNPVTSGADGAGLGQTPIPGASPATDTVAASSLLEGGESAALGSQPAGGSLSLGGQGGDPGGGVTTFTVTVPGSGMVFNNTITAGFTTAFQQDIVDAEDALAGNWTNSITLNLSFSAVNDGNTGFLATNSWPSFVNVSYATLKSALAAHDQGDTFAQEAVAALPANDPNPAGGNDWALPEAYARMLGLSSATPTADDTVTLNTFYLQDATVGQDVINAMTHEISEGAMGRVGGLGDQNSVWSTMDLFRYAASGQPDYTDGRDSVITYFSFDGGHTTSQSVPLAFNNQYIGASHNNMGDTADFTQLDVFGVGNANETFTLSQTDIEIMDVLGWSPGTVTTPPPTPFTPTGTVADMILQDSNTGNLQIWDFGNNANLAQFALGQLGLSWQFGGLGNFNGTDTSDMIMRDSNTGNIDVFDIANSQVQNAVTIGNLSSTWQFAGFGDFSGNFNGNIPETDMIMSNANNGLLQVFDIQNNRIIGNNTLGQVGTNWTIVGVGDFSSVANESDFIMRDTNTGAIDCFDVQRNQIAGSGALGGIGLNWQIGGVGDFSTNPNETDIMIRDTNTGNLQIFDVQNNRIVGSTGTIGTLGTAWQFAGFININGASNETDMIMRNANSGAFEYFDIRHNQIVGSGSLGAAGTNWMSLGVAAVAGASDPPDVNFHAMSMFMA